MTSIGEMIKSEREAAADYGEMLGVYRHIFAIYPMDVPIEICSIMSELSIVRLQSLIESGSFPGKVVADGSRKRYIVWTGEWLKEIGLSEAVLRG